MPRERVEPQMRPDATLILDTLAIHSPEPKSDEWAGQCGVAATASSHFSDHYSNLIDWLPPPPHPHSVGVLNGCSASETRYLHLAHSRRLPNNTVIPAQVPDNKLMNTEEMFNVSLPPLHSLSFDCRESNEKRAERKGGLLGSFACELGQS